MATAEELLEVRKNTNEPNEDTFEDATLMAYIDTLGGVDAASAKVWELKASAYADLVDVSEAGASRKMSDLNKNALAMQKLYSDKAGAVVEEDVRPRAKTHQIVRNT